MHALALHHRVVMFDNSGVGRTQELPQPFSVDAMADETSAFITALGVGRPDVLGWSMGGMIAQALAVLHPAQVRRLVLCATYPGSGQTVLPPVADLRAASDHALARIIPGATLVLYPDGGHAFLFQDWARFASLVNSFLAGNSSRNGRGSTALSPIRAGSGSG